ncbi:MAG: 3-isopropylmalate dehydratase large subunit [Gammaproteobacteria bacterium]|nr:3-isopropylmalate dehydratase large subunit [Gammaproteobacteria bacterium]MYG11468.1 3-isopropylmalate dehydratase large subunit [Gammaproteobacteria bacterium]MYK27892.1 3-isopropylmalate dehydratase large subunit [Gammaproteobacteria bacterium]
MSGTLFDKLWDSHCIETDGDGASLLYVDRVVMHERTGAVALDSLARRRRSVRRPEHAFCVADHVVDTLPGRSDDTRVPGGRDFIVALRQGAASFGLRMFDVDDEDQGICHLVSAEQGIALPGLSLVCPDSHTCTLGALGTLAFGIGTSELEHALATSTLRAIKPATLRVSISGQLLGHATAKDLALTLISTHGVGGAGGAAVEFQGAGIDAMTLEQRMTLCNMAAEFGAATAVIAPDEVVFRQAAVAPLAPKDAPIAGWRALRSDASARFDHDIAIDSAQVVPQVTWGTSPEQCGGLGDPIPSPKDAAARQALDYMGLEPGLPLASKPIDAAFIGSCTNARISDIRAAARVLKGHRVAAGVTAICVPGSKRVKRQAEAEGLDQVFKAAGFEWREPGCSMCFFAGGETFGAGKRVVTSTNRNFESRQGPGVRSHLTSPAVVAASAIHGRIALPDTA